MGDQTRFEGLDVAEVANEVTGGGTHDSYVRVGLGDEGTAIVRWRCVNVKHPLKAGEVVRVQTLNVTEVEDVEVLEKYSPPPRAEQPELPPEPEGAEVPIEA